MEKAKSDYVRSRSMEKLVEYVADFNLLFLTMDSSKIDEILPYEEDSINSRTLTQNNFGTVEFSAFDTGQSSCHYSGEEESLLQIVEGEATVVIGGNIIQGEAGQLVAIPAETSVIISAPRRTRILLVYSRHHEAKTSLASSKKELIAY